LLRMGPIAVRTGLAAVCFATVLVGLVFSAEVQLGVLASVLVAGIVADNRALARAAL
jgi:hypothetical protein